MRSGSENGSGLSSSEYTVEKMAVVAPMQSARVSSVVVAMPRLFQRRRRAWRRSPRAPVSSPADAGAEVREEDMVGITRLGGLKLQRICHATTPNTPPTP